MNRLAAEASPYLLQHKDDPIDWRLRSSPLSAAHLPVAASAAERGPMEVHHVGTDPRLRGTLRRTFLPDGVVVRQPSATWPSAGRSADGIYVCANGQCFPVAVTGEELQGTLDRV